MRNLNLEAAIWYLFSSPYFFKAASKEFEEIMSWFGRLAIYHKAANYGRNNQIYDKFKDLANNFKKAAELAVHGDYRMIWNAAGSVRGDIRGIMEQPLHGWMSDSEYLMFSEVKISRILAYSHLIEHALNNTMAGADSFYSPDPDCPERSNDDDGFPGDSIVEHYKNYVGCNTEKALPVFVDTSLEYAVERSVACRTGDEVPWTGVWYPDTGLERHSLTFAIKGERMQPVYRVIKSVEELEADGVLLPYPETVAVSTAWHPVKLVESRHKTNEELWAKAGQPCPKAGVWQPTDPGAAQRTYQEGEPMLDLKSAYGFTVWRWIADR
ncbi:MAG: hypothetical protein AB1807_07740 [Pseudomonadota bacterium]